MTAKTPAERQADRKVRETEAGRVQFKRWVHPDDVPAMHAEAERLERKRLRGLKRANVGIEPPYSVGSNDGLGAHPRAAPSKG